MEERRILRALLVAACALAALFAPGARAASVPDVHVAFVDSTPRDGRCSDSRDAGAVRNPDKPWCSVSRAIEAAPAGTTIMVRGGTYKPGVLSRSRGGLIRLRAYRGERVDLGQVTIASSNLRLEGLRMSGGVNVGRGVRKVAIVGGRTTNINIQAGANHVLIAGNRIAQRRSLRGINGINFNATNRQRSIRNVTIRDNRIGPIPGGGDGIQAKHTVGLTLEHNEIFGVRRPARSGAHPDAFQSIFGARKLTIRDNFIHDIAAQGIFVEHYQGANSGFVAEDNVVARVKAPWTAFFFTANHSRVSHNTVEGIIRANGRPVHLLANIATGGVVAAPTSHITRERYNLASRFPRAPGPGSRKAQPLFRHARGNDFRLKEGSPGRHAAPGRKDVGSRRADWKHPKFRR
jgi:hypothetical protein